MNKDLSLPLLGILGGTGKEGKGLCYRWAKAGYPINIGSRTPEKARLVSRELLDRLEGNARIEGTDILSAARQAEIVILTVPYEAHREVLELAKSVIADKIVIDVTVPLTRSGGTIRRIPNERSAAEEAHQILGDTSRVCAAFQNISHKQLLEDDPVTCDVLVTGTDKEAREMTINLVRAAGFAGWEAGPLENSIYVEGLTSMLIAINQKYHSARAGIKITGVSIQ